MENEAVVKKKKGPFFTGLVGLINRVMPGKNEQQGLAGSRFDLYVREVDKKDEAFEVVKKSAELCDEAILVAKQRISVIKKIHQLDEQMIELECYEKLTEQELDVLKNLIERFISLNRDRNALRFQMTGFDKGLVEMEKKEEDAKYVLEHMEESEKNQKILRRDLNMLQGEKAELEYEYDQMITAQDFIYKLSVFLVIFFGVTALALGYIFIIQRTQIFYPTAILCLFLIMIVSFIYIFRRKIKYELKMNLLKQHRAVDFINKKNVVYAYYTNFLRYVYRKYNVRSSEKLKKNIRDFSDYKNVTHRFDSIRNSMYQTEYDIENFLREKNISNAMITIEKFAKTIDIDDKRKVYNDYATEKHRLEDRLSDLDKIHEGIWNELVILGEADTTEGRVVDKITQHYVEEVSHIAKINMDFGESDEASDAEIAEIMKLAGSFKLDGSMQASN